VNVMAMATNARGETRLHVDALDLYAARLRSIFAKQAAKELGHKEESIERDLNTFDPETRRSATRVDRKNSEAQEEKIEMTVRKKRRSRTTARSAPAGTHPRRHRAVRGGGEETNKLVSYLAVTSRLLESPLAILVQSSSAAGKSALMEAVLAMLPEEQRCSTRR